MRVKKRHIKVDIDDALHLQVFMSYGRSAIDDCVGCIVEEGHIDYIYSKTALGTTTATAPLLTVFAPRMHENWWQQMWLYLQSWYNVTEEAAKVATKESRDA
jgi:hypothetical protein